MNNKEIKKAKQKIIKGKFCDYLIIKNKGYAITRTFKTIKKTKQEREDKPKEKMEDE